MDLENQSDDLVEQIINDGKVVFSHDWDSGGAGAGAGCEQVYHWKGMYAICSPESGNAGPFASLDEALQERDLLAVTNATTAVYCATLSAKNLAKRLKCDIDVDLLEEDGIEEGEFEIEINEETWVYRSEANEFKRKRGKK